MEQKDMRETQKDTIGSFEPTYTECMIQAQIDLLNVDIEEKIRRKWILEDVKRKLSIVLESKEKGE